MHKLILQANDIKKRFGDLNVLKGISLDVSVGDVIAIVGPSGSGKSTFLRSLNVLETIDDGSIYIDGEALAETINGEVVYPKEKELRRIRRKLGMVFQNFNLFPHMTALQNVMEGPVYTGKKDKKEAEKEAKDLLEKVGLSDKADCYPFELSGGQQQRVGIARALALDPEIICFDEPTSALDPELTGEVLGVIQKLAAAGSTMVIVTHEMNFARNVANHVVFMADGVIVEQGTPEEIFEYPQHPRTQAFLGMINRG